MVTTTTWSIGWFRLLKFLPKMSEFLKKLRNSISLHSATVFKGSLRGCSALMQRLLADGVAREREGAWRNKEIMHGEVNGHFI